MISRYRYPAPLNGKGTGYWPVIAKKYYWDFTCSDMVYSGTNYRICNNLLPPPPRGQNNRFVMISSPHPLYVYRPCMQCTVGSQLAFCTYSCFTSYVCPFLSPKKSISPLRPYLCSFAFICPYSSSSLWNSLPHPIKDCSSLSTHLAKHFTCLIITFIPVIYIYIANTYLCHSRIFLLLFILAMLLSILFDLKKNV